MTPHSVVYIVTKIQLHDVLNLPLKFQLYSIVNTRAILNRKILF